MDCRSYKCLLVLISRLQKCNSWSVGSRQKFPKLWYFFIGLLIVDWPSFLCQTRKDGLFFCIFINEGAKKVNLKFIYCSLLENIHFMLFSHVYCLPTPLWFAIKIWNYFGEIIPKPVIKSCEGVTEAWLGGVNTNFWSGTLTQLWNHDSAKRSPLHWAM